MINKTFVEQVETLVRLGYPAMFSMPEQTFIDSLAILESHVPTAPDDAAGQVPFAIVINSQRSPVEVTLPLAQRKGMAPVEKLYPKKPDDFVPQIELPNGEAYLLIDIDRGADFLNITPDAAHLAITKAGRSPLTISEGVAVLTHAPDLLQPNMCFSLLASRCGDKRVPALWLSEGRPKLGWCWAGNPHTWLGSASCAKRVGTASLHAAELSAA
jgi:hypothetical protein